MTEKFKLKSSVKYPTSIIVRGNDFLAVEIAKSLIEQGGYVVVIDNNPEEVRNLYSKIKDQKLLSIIDFSTIEYLEDDLRRLDYIFFLNHQYDDASQEISSQDFLHASNYLDLMINLAVKYEAKFLLSSSIRAHQLILNNTDIDMNFGKAVAKTQKVYTQLEIQRYAEALTLESVEKLNLNARITRLGYIIGPNMVFDLSANFDRLVVQAAQGQDLEVYSDGLETTMYVHVLDAAYGIIKAMFAKGTSGDIYSIANEEEVTDLSIAYRLQEMTGLNREIKFVDSKDALPPIRFYKPAVNLSILGWRPRISFTRALSQVLEYANMRNARQNIEGREVYAEDPTQQNELDDEYEPKGALARLIAERKAQENARRGSILLANEKLREKAKNKRNLTRYEKIQRSVQAKYDSLAYRLRFLKSITVIEAFLYLALFVIFGIVYIGLISPAFVIGREVVTLKYYTDKSRDALEVGDYNSFIAKTEKVNKSINTITDSYKNFRIVYKLTGQTSVYRENENALNSMKLYTQSLSSALNIVSAFNEYWYTQDFGLIYTPNSTSILSVGQSVGNEDNVNKLRASEIKLEQSIDRLNMSHESAKDKTDIKFLGIDLKSHLNSVLASKEEVLRALNLTSTVSELVLTEKLTTYGLIIQDNSRYTPAGGYPAALGYIQVQNGQVKSIYLAPLVEDSTLSVDNLATSKLKQIELISDIPVNDQNIGINELFLIKDRATFIDDLKQIYKGEFRVEPDSFIFLDLQSVASILSITGPVEINRVSIDQGSLLNSLEFLQGSENSIDKRNEVITNIFAQLIANLATDKTILYTGLPIFNQQSARRGLVIESLDYNIREIFYGDNIASRGNDWIEVRASIDPKQSDINVFSSLNLRIEDEYRENLDVLRQVTLSSGNSVDLEKVLICMPPNTSNFEFIEGSTALGQSFSSNEICVVGDFTSVKSVSFSYELSGQIDKLSNSNYNIRSNFLVAPGVDVVYDWDVTLSPAIKLVDSGSMIMSNQKLIATGTLEGDKTINFTVNK